MRIFFLAAFVVGAAASVAMVPTSVAARDFPFCIKGDNYGSALGDCSFDTYAQCLATASGRLAFCDANPYYGYPNRPNLVYPKQRHRHH